MASALIHLAVAKKLTENINIKNRKDYYLGSIAPDLSKQIGLNKISSHFLIHTKEDVPNTEMFINKYPNFMNNEFELGYFIHLYTDKLWFDGFLNNFICNNSIKLLDGTVITTTPEELQNIIYQDYTNLNIKLLDEYKMDLSLFYEDFIKPNTKLDEIPSDKLNILIDKMGLIIENSKEEKPYTFDTFLILDFIDKVSQEILEILKNRD